MLHLNHLLPPSSSLKHGDISLPLQTSAKTNDPGYLLSIPVWTSILSPALFRNMENFTESRKFNVVSELQTERSAVVTAEAICICLY